MKKEMVPNITDKKTTPQKSKVKISHRFITALSIVSILGFAGIVSQTLFNFNLENYVEALLMIIVGGGLIFEARAKNLKTIAKGLNTNNFTHLTTVIIGVIAIFSGIFSFPQIRITFPGFEAIKGIMAVIAIIVIIIQTWVVD